jgi:hypothetical protein
MNISFEKITELLTSANLTFNQEKNPETKPCIGLRDDELVLWIVYDSKFWSISLSDFNFENIDDEFMKNKTEMVE